MSTREENTVGNGSSGYYRALKKTSLSTNPRAISSLILVATHSRAEHVYVNNHNSRTRSCSRGVKVIISHKIVEWYVQPTGRYLANTSTSPRDSLIAEVPLIRPSSRLRQMSPPPHISMYIHTGRHRNKQINLPSYAMIVLNASSPLLCPKWGGEER